MGKKHKQSTSPSNVPPEMDHSYFSPIEVQVDGNFERAFKIFRSIVQAEGILALYKEKQSYEKPSEKKRRKHNESCRRVLEAEMKQKKILSGEYEKEKLKKLKKKGKKDNDRNEG